MPEQEQSPVLEEEPAVAATPEVKTPTPEEQLKALQAQLDTTKAEKQKTEESYKGLQRTLNKSNEELRRQADLKAELADLREAQKLQAALMAEYLGKPQESLDDDTKNRKPDLLKVYQDQVTNLEVKRKQADYNRQADEIWSKAKSLGLPEDDDNILDIEDYLRAGNLKRAQAKITKLEGAKKPVEPEKKEAEDERINRLVQERINKMIEEKGLLKTDTAVPSGRAASNTDVIRRYSEGDSSISEADYLRATGRG